MRLAGLAQWMRAIWRRRELDRELEEELQAHLACKQARLEEDGLPPREAARQARLALGNLTRWQETTREQWSFPALESFWQDLAYTARTLRKQPLFTAVALSTLALAIGGNAAIFALLNTVLWRSLPVRQPEQLVRVRVTNLPPTDRAWVNGRAVEAKERSRIPFALYEALAAERLFSDVGGMAGQTAMVAEVGGHPERLQAATVTGSFFPTLGVEAAYGRLLLPSDDVPGGSPSGWGTVISYRLWSRLFSERADAIGSALYIQRIRFTVVGVAPRHFDGVTPGAETDIWIPLSAFETMYPKWRWRSDSGIWMLETLGRMQPGYSLEQTAQQLHALSLPLLRKVKPPELGAADERHFLSMKLDAVSARSGFSRISGSFGPALWTMLAVLSAVLLIAAANLTNLLLAKASAQRQETAMRIALGASRGRIRRLFLLQSAALAIAGSALGLVLAYWLVRALPAALSLHLDVPLDWKVLAFLAGVLALVVVVVGWVPASAAIRHAALQNVKSGAASHAATYQRSALVIVQIAFCFALVGGAGLLLSSMYRVFHEATGFDTGGTVFLTPDLLSAGVSPERMPEAYRRILEEVRKQPGVAAAAWTLHVPLNGGLEAYTIEVPGSMHTAPQDRMVFSHQVTNGYFSTMGVPLLAGSDFPSRPAGQRRFSIVSENLARRFFGSAESAIGRRLRAGGLGWTEITGVVADTKFQDVREPTPLTVYTSYWEQRTTLPLNLAVRHHGRREPLLGALRQLFEREAGRSVLTRTSTLRDNIGSSVATERLLTAGLAAFALFALLVSTTGVAGLLSYTVQLRRREIGVRLALGAAPGEVAKTFQAQGFLLALAGIAAGAVLSFTGYRIIEAYLFGVTPGNWRVWLASGTLVLLCTAAATLIPALRAARLDPMAVLRCE